MSLSIYPHRRKRFTRMHRSVLIAVVINAVLLTAMGAFAGNFADESVYEVNLMDVMRKDADVRLPKEKAPNALTLDPAQAPSPGHSGGRHAPASAPGQRSENRMAQAPPPLNIHAPTVAPDAGPTEDVPTIVNRPPPPPDATANGNPEGASGGKGSDEGPGGHGTGGIGSGGVGTGGNGNGTGGGFSQLVNRVNCLGCHDSINHVERDTTPRPYEIERLFAEQHWRPGGSPHNLTLEVTINDQGYITRAEVIQSSGNADVDQSAMDLLRQSKWHPATLQGVAVPSNVQIPLEVYY